MQPHIYTSTSTGRAHRTGTVVQDNSRSTSFQKYPLTGNIGRMDDCGQRRGGLVMSMPRWFKGGPSNIRTTLHTCPSTQVQALANWSLQKSENAKHISRRICHRPSPSTAGSGIPDRVPPCSRWRRLCAARPVGLWPPSRMCEPQAISPTPHNRVTAWECLGQCSTISFSTLSAASQTSIFSTLFPLVSC